MQGLHYKRDNNSRAGAERERFYRVAERTARSSYNLYIYIYISVSLMLVVVLYCAGVALKIEVQTLRLFPLHSQCVVYTGVPRYIS